MASADTVKCIPCDQVLTKARYPAHLTSKKHADAVAKHGGAAVEKAAEGSDDPVDEPEPAGGSPPSSATTPKAATAAPAKGAATEDTATAAPATGAAAKETSAATPVKAPAAKPASSLLAEDPDTPGHYWCGICRVSLGPARADAHLDTQRHAVAVAKLVAESIKAPKPAA